MRASQLRPQPRICAGPRPTYHVAVAYAYKTQKAKACGIANPCLCDIGACSETVRRCPSVGQDAKACLIAISEESMADTFTSPPVARPVVEWVFSALRCVRRIPVVTTVLQHPG